MQAGYTTGFEESIEEKNIFSMSHEQSRFQEGTASVRKNPVNEDGKTIGQEFALERLERMETGLPASDRPNRGFSLSVCQENSELGVPRSLACGG
jgi:hypothetical protein